MRTVSKYAIAPEYLRIPHFNSEISNMTHDDIQLESPIKFPFTCHVQEKIDAANLRISWNDGPILGNREHILSKGYSKIRTPAKQQFQSAWNYLHAHEKDIKKVSNAWQSPITIFGEWCYAKHSLFYDKLPDLFMAYDIFSYEDDKYLSPDVVEDLLSKTNIKFIKPKKVTINSIDEIVEMSEEESDFRNGKREGIVIKLSEGSFCEQMFKVVNKYFIRDNGFNEREIIKNKIIKI